MVWLRLVFYPVAIALAALLLIDALEAARLTQAAADMQSPAGAARMEWELWLERLSLSLYEGGSELAAAYEAVVANAARVTTRVWMLAATLAALATIHLALVFATTRRAEARAVHLALVGLVGFALGVAAPMLSVTAHADLPVVGEVILRHDSKSILSTVLHLATHDNLILAVLITLFSVVLPLAKTTLVLAAVQGARVSWRKRSLEIMHVFGKWSMADVFVVAVLMSQLALDEDEFSAAAVGPGLYFFVAYCLLSLWSSQIAAQAGGRP